MSRNLLQLLLGIVLWIAWCVLVVVQLVPFIRLKITMWPWLMSYVLCLAPVLAAAVVALIRVRKNVDV